MLLGSAAIIIWTLCVSPWGDRWPERLRSPQKRRFLALGVAVSTGVGLWWHEEYGDTWASMYGMAMAAWQAAAWVLEHEFGWFGD